MTISLGFKSYDTKSTISFTWQDGEIGQAVKRPQGVHALLLEPPQSVAAFEALCRSASCFGQKWQCQSVVGVAS